MRERMFGVVLWADASDTKAVIWCEDHGNLAYYCAPDQSVHCGMALDAGDLIQFDLREDRDIRQASNLERVGSGYARGLADRLRGAGKAPGMAPDMTPDMAPELCARPGDNVVALSEWRGR